MCITCSKWYQFVRFCYSIDSLNGWTVFSCVSYQFSCERQNHLLTWKYWLCVFILQTPPFRTCHLSPYGLVFVSVDVQHSVRTPFFSISQSSYKNGWVLQFETVGMWYQFHSSIILSSSSKVLWFLPTKKDVFPLESVSRGMFSCEICRVLSMK